MPETLTHTERVGRAVYLLCCRQGGLTETQLCYELQTSRRNIQRMMRILSRKIPVYCVVCDDPEADQRWRMLGS